jgi:hypothetical protein
MRRDVTNTSVPALRIVTVTSEMKSTRGKES